MPQAIIWIDEMANIIVESYARKWDISKAETIIKMVKLFQEYEEASEKEAKKDGSI